MPSHELARCSRPHTYTKRHPGRSTPPKTVTPSIFERFPQPRHPPTHDSSLTTHRPRPPAPPLLCSSVYLVFEYCDNDIACMLEKMDRPFSESEVKCLMLQLLEAVAYIHDNWVIHRCGRRAHTHAVFLFTAQGPVLPTLTLLLTLTLTLTHTSTRVHALSSIFFCACACEPQRPEDAQSAIQGRAVEGGGFRAGADIRVPRPILHTQGATGALSCIANACVPLLGGLCAA